MKNKKLIVVAVLIAASAVAYTVWRKRGVTEVTFREVKVATGDLNLSILSTGVVQPQNRLEIKPPIAGRAETVLVDEGQSVKKGQVLVWMSSTERAALLDAARARGTGELKNWEEYYKATPILAPIDGTIIQRNIQPGQTFTTSDAVLVMSDRLTIQAQVDETDISQIHLKQKASVVLDAYPGVSIPAHVDKIAYDAKTVNNVTTYIVDALPEETPKTMRSGMTANVSFLSAAKSGVLYLPSEAIKRRADGTSYVMAPDRNGGTKSIERPIEIGITDGKRTEITSGLSEGEVVLVPQMKLGIKTQASTPFSPMGSKPRGGR